MILFLEYTENYILGILKLKSFETKKNKKLKKVKNIILILSINLLFISCKENKKALISGEIKNLPDSSYININAFYFKPKKVDSVFMQKDNFLVDFKNNKEGLYYMEIKNIKDSTLYFLEFWYEKKELKIIGDFNNKDDIKFTNSTINDFLRAYRSIPEKYMTNIENTFKKIKDPKKGEILYEKFMDSIQNDQIDFLLVKPKNQFSIDEILILKHKISKNKLTTFFNELDEELKISSGGKLIAEYLSSRQIKIGEKFIDFTAKDLAGNNIKLSDFKGKIILLDFWANWCTWCHVQNKEEFTYLNEKYKKDLVIVSYALDEEKQVWENSVKKDSYRWINLSNLKGLNDPVTYNYNVSLLPHSFLINKEGIITKQFIGYKKDSLIEKELKKLLH